MSKLGQPLRAAVEHRRAEQRRPLDQREAARHRPPAHAAVLRARDFRAPASRGDSDQSRDRSPASRAHPSLQSQPPASSCSTTPSPTTTTRRSASPRRCVLDAAGIGVRLAPHGVLRTAADLAGARSTRRARGAGERRRPVRRARAASASSSSRPSCLSAVREDAPALLRGEAQRKARGRRRCVRAVRGLRRAGMAGGTDAARSARRAVDGAAARALPLRRPMGLMPQARALLRPHPVVHGGRSRRRLLRDGRIVRVRARALRGVAADWRAEAAARRARRWRRTASSSPPACRAGSRSRTFTGACASTRRSCSRRSSKLRT